MPPTQAYMHHKLLWAGICITECLKIIGKEFQDLL